VTPVETIDTICAFLREKLVNLHDGKITIYPYFLPEPAPTPMTQNANPTDPYEGMMPAIIVTPISYEDKAFEDGTSLLSVSLMAGVFSNNQVEGPWGVMNILERIRRLLLTYRVLDDACEVQEPLSWQMFDDETKPLWYGEMMTQWRIIVPDRMEDEDWRGDLIRPGS
jgi:hypothetical protein